MIFIDCGTTTDVKRNQDGYVSNKKQLWIAIEEDELAIIRDAFRQDIDQ